MDINMIVSLVALSCLIGIGYALKTNIWVLRQNPGNEKMTEIAQAIKEGAYAFLNREYTYISLVALILIAIIWVFYSPVASISFAIGAIGSALAGFLGMMVNVRANTRTAQAANSDIKTAFNVAFRGGTVTGLMVSSLALLSVTFYCYMVKDNIHQALLGLMLGSSLVSVFARGGGGIFTKAADVGADLVGKVETNIPEDDPRNPAVIADNVGDNVGDCAGMAADIYETYVVTLSASILLTMTILGKDSPWIYLPLIIGGVAIMASLISIATTRLSKTGNVMACFYRALIVCGILIVFGIWSISPWLLSLPGFEPIFTTNQLLYLMSLGVLLTIAIMFITDYFTSSSFSPVKSIAAASESGHATNITIGHSIGLKSTVPIILSVLTVVFLSYWIGGGFNGNEKLGLLAMSFTASAMVSMTSMIIAIDAYGPITDNAGGIAEMSRAPQKVRKITDKLDAYGNTTKATTKGFAIGSAGLATLVLFNEYNSSFDQNIVLDLSDPLIFGGLLLGGCFAYWFASKLLQAVGDTAKFVVKEVREQFADGKILAGKRKPDYGKCVSIVTKASLIKMIVPATSCVIMPILIGFTFGKIALGGFIFGVVLSGLLLAISMTNSGGAYDNAKKHIEDGHHGGKGSRAHQASVTGDTVGDPRKDTAGPAMNPMIKVVSIVSLIIAPFI